MLDPTALLTELYVLIDDWDKTQPPPLPTPGPAPHLCRSEVLTLAVFGQWDVFASERAFWRYAERRLRPLFPGLPSRIQFLRAVRRWADHLAALAVWLGQQLAAPSCPYEIIDATGVATRNAQRRGRGWLAAQSGKGKCSRLGWYWGVRLLVSSTPQGAITGFVLDPANRNERHLAETLLAERAQPEPRLPSAGQAVSQCYLADGGFAGAEWEQRWQTAYGAEVHCPPQGNHARAWSAEQRRDLAARRQIIETVMERLLNRFRLATDRLHSLAGLQARTAAKVTLHNVCLWLNRRLGRPALAFAELVDW